MSNLAVCLANTYNCKKGFAFTFFYWEFVQIFKGRLEQSHRGADLIPFIKQREKEMARKRLRVSSLA